MYTEKICRDVVDSTIICYHPHLVSLFCAVLVSLDLDTFFTFGACLSNDYSCRYVMKVQSVIVHDLGLGVYFVVKIKA